MAKHLSVLRRFEIWGDDGGTDLVHRHQDCDWRTYADSRSLPELMREATAHAKVCDGKPQPRKPAESRSMLPSGFVPDLWAATIKYALEAKLVGSVKPVGDLSGIVHVEPFDADHEE